MYEDVGGELESLLQTTGIINSGHQALSREVIFPKVTERGVEEPEKEAVPPVIPRLWALCIAQRTQQVH